MSTVMNTTNTQAASPPDARSPEYVQWLAQIQRRKLLITASRIGVLAVFLAVWEVLARTQVINPMLTSYPSAVLPTLVDLFKTGDLTGHTWITFKATIIGFAVSMVLGVLIAALLWWSGFLKKVLDPFLVIANAMPKIAFVPIFYIWLGSEYSVYGMAVAISLFITIMVVYEGFQAIDPNKIKLATTLGASKMQVMRYVVFPGSVPAVIAAIKMNIGLSLIGVIVGEFQSSSAGLGFLIVNGSQVFKLNIVMAAIVVLAMLSAVMYLAVTRLEKAVQHRYA
ncbi:NitT/TauT family transport system permease protein [Comamonas odontotermitis]|uniref:NitT/TauT family transport system permease protein n=2 Tax=Comamonas odontotermitis TaxID=379895 RepID=A0ABR6RGH6_9BURK|nr:NitT/TauT family transport system permease protein [Comamonas odontotermitis]